MNNLRLLRGMLMATLLGYGTCAHAKTECIITLDSIFILAERQSVQMRPAFSMEEVSSQELREARAKRLPDINASLSLAYNGDGFITKRNFSDYQRAEIPHFGNELSLMVSQPVYAGGSITAGIELSELKLTATRYATELQRDNIRFQLTGFYLDIYKYRNLRIVLEKNITLARKVLKEMHAKHEQGIALQNDITRYELLLSNLELQLIKVDNTLEILNNNLVTIAGLPAGTVVLPDSEILTKSLPLTNEAEWQDMALQNSPQLRLAQSRVEINRKSESLVKSEFLPKIGLLAAWDINGPILTEVPPINRNLSYWFVGVNVSYNLASIFKSNKSLARSRAATIHANDEFLAMKENTELTVRTDYIRYLESYEELKTQQKSVELAERNYNTILTRYSADMALITDLLDAANSRLESEQQLVNAGINIIYYYYKLLFTTGKI